MDALLGFASIIGFIVCVVMIVVSAIKKTGKIKKWTIGTAVCFVVFIVAVAMPSDQATPSAPTTTTAVEPQKQEEVKLSETDKALLKGSYADFDSAQRTRFAGIEKTYAKLAGTDKEGFKGDFERLTAEKDVVVAKALEEAKKKAAEEEAARKAEEKAAAEAKIAAQKADAQTIPYRDLARNPDNYKGKNVKYTGEVIQVQEDGNMVGLRVNVTKNSYGYEDTIYVIYNKGIIEGRVLEDDIITLYGKSMGLLTYKTVLGAEMSIPQVIASIVELN